MNIKKISLSSLFIFLLSGCASVNTPMKHSDGRVINCSAAGLGLIGAPAALVMRENCVSNAKNNGFVPLDEIGTAPTSGAISTKVVYPGKVTITLPEGWVRSTPPSAYSAAIDFAKNATYDAFLVLTYIDKKQVTDVSIFAETKKAAQFSKLRDATSSETTKTEIRGRVAYVSDITGVLPTNGIRYRFRNTVVDAGSEILVLSVWATAANYDGKIKESLDNVSNGLNGF